MEKQISIIIPTYNMEAYIGKCLDSLLIPEIDQVEVLVVNDGSKDRSSEIAHGYADRYPGSIRVIDKPNGNYGSCINAALPQCTGRYVKVLDADDTFDTAAFSQFVRKLCDIESDVILTPFVVVDDNGSITDIQGNSIWKVPGDSSLLYADVHKLMAKTFVSMHRITYKTSLFRKFEYHQTEGFSYSDAQWSIIPLSFCDSFRFVDIYLYRYLIGRPGQTSDSAQISRSMQHYASVLHDLTEFYLSSKSFANCHREFLFSQVVELHRPIYFRFLNSQGDSINLLKNHDEYLRANIPAIYNAVGQLKYSHNINVQVFKILRRQNYPLAFRIPISARFWITICLKFQSISKSISK